MVNNYRYKVQARRKLSARDLIKYVSIDIYNRIGFVHKNGTSKTMIRAGEETLTENMVYELHKFTIETGICLVRLFESIGEDTNGADMLLDIPIANFYIRVPVQAKKISTYKNGTDGSYQSFYHKNTKGLQSKLLKDYANDVVKSFLPVYFLYNFTSKNKKNIDTGEKEHYYGISYFSLNSKFRNPLGKTVRFSDLHSEPANPLYKLFEKLGGGNGNGGGSGGGGKPPVKPLNPDNDSIREFYKRFGMDLADDDILKIRRYTQEEIFADTDNWTDLFSTEKKTKGKRKAESLEFKPRYRMVLLSDPTISGQDAEMVLTVGGSSKRLDDVETDPFIEHSFNAEQFSNYEIHCEI